MSFVFRGTRADIETGFPEFVSEWRPLRLNGPRNVHSNSLAFLVTAMVATALRMYATCQQVQAQSHGGLLGHTELRFHMPPTISLATRARLQGLRLQLALLDREFDDLDYETLRALDADNVPTTASMSEEEINALPVHKYKGSTSQTDSSSLKQPCYAAEMVEKLGNTDVMGVDKASEDELTCSVCLELVGVGEIIRSLPCLHQFHASCIDPWLRQRGTCPICKFRAGQFETDASYMV